MRIEDWNDNDIDGIASVLKDEDLPYDLKLEIFKSMLSFYSKAREQVGRIAETVSPGTVASRVIKGLIILMENFERFAEVKKPEEFIFPNLVPPNPRPKEDLLSEVVSITENSKQVILIGPPGSGKTHLAMWAAHILITNERRRGFWVLVQFHRSYRYDDFIERMILKSRDGHIELVVEPQLFVKLCRYAQQNPDKRIVLVIDEINRADVASVFGELIYALEYRGYPVKLTYSGEYLVVPENLYIIATANDIDRGTFDIGVALRRRFEVIRIDASEEALRELLQGQGAPDSVINAAVNIFNNVNKLFEELIGKKGLGHLFFKGVRDKESLVNVWKFRVKPLIETYFLTTGIMSQRVRQLIKDIESQLDKL
ncbi:McrB family protein [Vulcanisaeta sp. JCM 14467]|uniref:McrB family protein n=1 Tax=Vulcanisaeta sp. JCM 14467 TaxID=1295370 RepID=UPI0006D273CA|nr:AAA family ATPase [Vulcanisaeta sp. JCM 14467]